ncbi:MAG: hypothetical protein LUF87_08835 [Alistipes sp.]|nr:hypothetical protein [Alistipes sp.]
MKKAFTVLIIMISAITAKAQQLEYFTEDDFVLTIIQAEIDSGNMPIAMIMKQELRK